MNKFDSVRELISNTIVEIVNSFKEKDESKLAENYTHMIKNLNEAIDLISQIELILLETDKSLGLSYDEGEEEENDIEQLEKAERENLQALLEGVKVAVQNATGLNVNFSVESYR